MSLLAGTSDIVLFAPTVEVAGAAIDFGRYLAVESGGTTRLHVQTGACPKVQSPGIQTLICVHKIATPPADHPSGSAKKDRAGIWQVAVVAPGYLAHEIGHTLGLADLYKAGGQSGSHEYLMGYVGDSPLSLSLLHLRQLGFATPLFGRSDTDQTTLFPGDQLPFCQQNDCLYIGLHWRPIPGGGVTPFLEAEWDRPNQFPVRLEFRTLGNEAARGLWTPPKLVPGPREIRWEYAPLPLPHVQLHYAPYAETLSVPPPRSNSWGVVPGLLMLVLLGLLLRSARTSIRLRNESPPQDQSGKHATPDTK